MTGRSSKICFKHIFNITVDQQVCMISFDGVLSSWTFLYFYGIINRWCAGLLICCEGAGREISPRSWILALTIISLHLNQIRQGFRGLRLGLGDSTLLCRKRTRRCQSRPVLLLGSHILGPYLDQPRKLQEW